MPTPATPVSAGAGTGPDGDDPVVVSGLRKSYGPFRAVDDLDLRVRRGEVLALLGPNGAGKTTTVEILQGFRRRDGGQVSVLGADPAHDRRGWRARIGVVPQSTGGYDDLTVSDVLRHFTALYPRPLPVGRLLEMVGLAAKANVRASTLSGGQQRRLDVAVGVAGDPELIFLDEPTTGLDPAARREAWELVRFFAGRGATTLLTTHYLDEAQALADRAAVIVGGRVVECGPVDQLGAAHRSGATISFRLSRGQSASSVRALFPQLAVDGAGQVSWESTTPTSDLGRLLAWAEQHRLGEITDLQLRRPSLEDNYLRIVAEHTGQPPAADLAGVRAS